ncbi:Programmed cell death protein 2, C-terminal [Dillenia turbinata]|uniref:Programmed cell death protein 2, C-terminal n=1 Tax=Dillenia turbinata TaxID=194707 RepID=A0AAN8V9U4_9MAGN
MSEDILDNFKALQKCSLEEEEEEEEEDIVIEDAGDDEGDDDDDDEEEEEEEPTTLGFVEKPKNRWSLLRHLFPSKAGGVPAWLDPVNLPSGRLCKCDFCDEPLHFVMQVYAPISDKDLTFHRTIFVFMCRSMSCLLKDQHGQWQRQPDKALRSVKVFRCQLPRSNPFYSSEPPRYNGTDKPSGDGVAAALCDWCGTWKGDKVCSNCRKARYCSEKHQTRHWRCGHKVACQKMILSSSDSIPCKITSTSADLPKDARDTLWPEFEIINEDESEYDLEETTDTNKANSLVLAGRVDDTINSMMDTFEGDGDKKSWASFQVRISKAPDQVLRYSRGARAKPLWPMSGGRPSKADIPKCCYCGGPRIFEFQILPQLLYYFGVKNDVDSLDWATLVVYTCEASCEASVAYKEESVWIQLSSSSPSMPC